MSAMPNQDGPSLSMPGKTRLSERLMLINLKMLFSKTAAILSDAKDAL